MSKLAVIDRDGWRKEFSISKPITFIGSDPADDIVLDASRGGGVNPRHVQLLLQGGTGRVVTLGGPLVISGLSGQQTVAAYSSAVFNPGDSLRLGDFQLSILLEGGVPAPQPVAAAPVVAPPVAAVVTPAIPVQPAPAVSAPASAATASAPVTAPPVVPVAAPTPVAATPAPAATPVEAPSPSIGVRLSLPGVPLGPDQPLEGVVTIRNQGGRPGAQFKIQIDGLDADCYEVGPGPILFPNAEKDVFVRLMHPKRPQPPAGYVTVTVRVTAPEAYPGEIAGASQVITILPYYNQTLRMTAV